MYFVTVYDETIQYTIQINNLKARCNCSLKSGTIKLMHPDYKFMTFYITVKLSPFKNTATPIICITLMTLSNAFKNCLWIWFALPWYISSKYTRIFIKLVYVIEVYHIMCLVLNKDCLTFIFVYGALKWILLHYCDVGKLFVAYFRDVTLLHAYWHLYT